MRVGCRALPSDSLPAPATLNGNRILLARLWTSVGTYGRSLGRRYFRSRFELAAEAGGLGLWEFDLGTRTITQTPLGAHQFDLPALTPTGVDRYFERILPADRQRVESSFQRSIDGLVGFEVVYRIQVKGALRWVRSAARLERGEHG